MIAVIWLWIPNLLAAFALVWGVRRMYRNHLRQRTGGRARYRELARVAVGAGLGWFVLYAGLLPSMMPKLWAQRRAEAIAELRAMGGRIPDNGGYADLSNTRVTDDDLRLLPAIPEIEELDLTYTGITDAGVKYLESMPRLQRINLDGTEVSDEGLKRIQSHIAIVRRVMASRLAAQEARQKAFEERQKLELAEREELEKKGAIKVEEEKYKKAIEEAQGRIGGR